MASMHSDGCARGPGPATARRAARRRGTHGRRPGRSGRRTSSASASRRRRGTCGCCARPASSSRCRAGSGGCTRCDPSRSTSVERWARGVRRFWEGRLDALDTEIARGVRGAAEKGTTMSDLTGRADPGRRRRRPCGSSAGTPTTPADLWSAVTDPERLVAVARPGLRRPARRAAGTSCGWATTWQVAAQNATGEIRECDDAEPAGASTWLFPGESSRPASRSRSGRTATAPCWSCSTWGSRSPRRAATAAGWHASLDQLADHVAGRAGAGVGPSCYAAAAAAVSRHRLSAAVSVDVPGARGPRPARRAPRTACASGGNTG